MMSNSYASRNMGMAGAVVGLVGLIAKGVAAATTPAADLRTWSSLPANVMLFTADIQPAAPVTITSASSATAPLPIQASKDGCWIGWARTRSSLPVAAGGTAVLAETSIETANREEKNAKFRAMLQSDFAPVASVATATPAAQGTSATGRTSGGTGGL